MLPSRRAPVDQYRTHWVDAALPHLQATDHAQSSRKRVGLDRPTEACSCMCCHREGEASETLRRQSTATGRCFSASRIMCRPTSGGSYLFAGEALIAVDQLFQPLPLSLWPASATILHARPGQALVFLLPRAAMYTRHPSRWESFGTLRKGRQRPNRPAGGKRGQRDKRRVLGQETPYQETPTYEII